LKQAEPDEKERALMLEKVTFKKKEYSLGNTIHLNFNLKGNNNSDKNKMGLRFGLGLVERMFTRLFI